MEALYDIKHSEKILNKIFPFLEIRINFKFKLIYSAKGLILEKTHKIKKKVWKSSQKIPNLIAL